MKIAVGIFRYFPFGGLQKDFLRIAEECARRGHEVLCITGKWDGERPAFLRIAEIPLSGRSNHARALDFEKRFHAMVLDEKPDRTIAFSRFGDTDFYFAADDCFAASLEKRQMPLLRFLPRYRIFSAQERAVFAPDAKTHVFYLTENQKHDFQRIYGTRDNRFTLLPPAGDPRCGIFPDSQRRREEKRTELGIQKDEILLFQAASDFFCKGTDRLIRAAAALPDGLRNQCRILIAGEKSPRRRNEMAALVKKSGLTGRVFLPGPRNDVPDLLCAADLMVHPARKESAGSVLAEALASGLPAVCTEVCGYENLLRNAGCPVLREPFRQAELNEVLSLLLSKGILAELRKKIEKTAGEMDFTRRAKVVADRIESGNIL